MTMAGKVLDRQTAGDLKTRWRGFLLAEHALRQVRQARDTGRRVTRRGRVTGWRVQKRG